MAFDYSTIDPLIEQGNIVKDYKYIHQDKLVEAFKILEQYCKDNPNDYEAKISLAVFAIDFPFYDDITALEILNEVLLVKEYYVKALVTRAKVEAIFLIIMNDTFQMIEQYVNSNPTTALYYGEMLMHQAFYFETQDMYKDMEKILLKSIKISPNFAWNYMLLGDLMVKKGKTKKANKYYKKALDNTTLIGDDSYMPPYDLEILLDELLRGTTQWSSNYNRLVKKYEQTMGQKSFIKKILKRLQTLLKRRNH
jgi:tetratricopeptide (TPR) repeat protein